MQRVSNISFELLKQVPTGLVIIEKNKGRFIYANKRAIELIGLDPWGLTFREYALNKAKIRKLDNSLCPYEELPLTKALLLGETCRNQELTLQRPNHTELSVSLNASPLTDETGEITGAVALFEDITEHKKLQETLQELKKLAEENAKQLKDAERLATIGQVAGMVGHDIRNPLQSIVNELYNAELELKEAPKSKVKQSCLESIVVIQEQIDYISKIVTDLQDYGKALHPFLVEVKLCESIRIALKNTNLPSNVQAEVICQENMLPLTLDETFLKRILDNLIINAVQAMPQGGKLIIKAHQDGANTVLTVEDTGVGIPEEAKNKIFLPLFTTKAKGQGFGLAVVKRMTESLGGTVTFESQVGKGTKFTLTLHKNEEV